MSDKGEDVKTKASACMCWCVSLRDQCRIKAGT